MNEKTDERYQTLLTKMKDFKEKVEGTNSVVLTTCPIKDSKESEITFDLTDGFMHTIDSEDDNDLEDLKGVLLKHVDSYISRLENEIGELSKS